jgi:hypothetical protein
VEPHGIRPLPPVLIDVGPFFSELFGHRVSLLDTPRTAPPWSGCGNLNPSAISPWNGSAPTC